MVTSAAVDEAEIKQQVERLEAARKDLKLLASVPRVVAAQFGAIPLGADGDSLEVAVAAGVTAETLAGLERALKRKVVPRRFDDGIVHLYLSRLYLKKENLNFHTFLEADFLERDDCCARLVEEKDMEPVKPRIAADPRRVVLLDYAYRSVLEPLDARSFSVSFDEEAACDLAFEVDDDDPLEPEVTIARADPLPDTVFILARESYSYAGIEHKHGWRAHEVDKLPFMVHPSELQVTGIEEDGTLHVFVYDRVERVRPGESPRFDVTYHFLSMGQRLKRRLTLKIYGVWSVRREAVKRTTESIRWRADDLRRWLGFDL